MAWYTPKYSCGHTGDRIQLYGKGSERDARLAAIARHDCPDCIVAKAAAANPGLPALVGSPKQIAWAVTIRDRAMRILPPAEAAKIAPETSAKWYIDHRSELGG